MPISYMDLLKTRFDNISSSEAAAILGITPSAVSRLVREGKIPGVKVGRVYLIPRIGVHEYAKGHEPRRGRPRKKRRYTRRSISTSGLPDGNGTPPQSLRPPTVLSD